MSLIVADRFNNDITIWSDSKITFKGGFLDDKNRDVKDAVEKYGCLKTYNLTDKICVSFAGNWEYMHKFMEWFISVVRVGYSINNIINKLISLNIESSGETDFILCLLHIEGSCIIKIQDGKCNDCPTAWIGDYDGFKLYQEEKLKYQKDFEIFNSIDEIRNFIMSNKVIMSFCMGGNVSLFFRSLPNNIFSELNYTKWYAARYVAFLKVVESVEVPVVGKFISEMLTSEQHIFLRPTEFCSKQKLPQQLKPPFKNNFSVNIPATGNSANGDFSYRVAPIANNRGLRVDIAEISKTIQYDVCQYPDSDFNLLLLPRLFSLGSDISNAETITIGPNGSIKISESNVEI